MRLAAPGRIPFDRILQASARLPELALPERDHAQEVLALDDEHRILVALPGGEQRDPVLPRVGELEPQEGVQGQPSKDRRTDGPSELDAEISSPRSSQGSPNHAPPRA